MSQTPFVSLVIPTHNRPVEIAACLEACVGLDYPADRFEVIVVDDGSVAPLNEVAAGFTDRLALRLARQENRGPGAARNRGAAEAKGEILAFTDDDCLPSQTWLRTIARKWAAAPDRSELAIGGRTVNALPRNPYSSASQLLISYLFSYYNAVPESSRFFPSNNLAFPAARFHSIGGFDEAYRAAAAEDRELCDRWLHHGGRLAYAEEAVIHHAHALTLGSFLRQHHRYGQGAFLFHRMRARRGKHRIEVEPARFYLDMFASPFRSAQSVSPLLLTVLLGLTQAANAAGFFREQARQRASSARLPIGPDASARAIQPDAEP